ncbi:MAG: AAA family ATPase [Campylobacterota bacterium]|nr:AAA family ATPase [Campylobacterota bacterium]
MNHLKQILQNLKSNKNIFLTGGAGVGKTTHLRKIIQEFEEDAKKVAKLASTGMAATLIGGQTLHSFLDLGLASDIKELQRDGKLEVKKKIKKLISSMDLIVIDEISMVSDTLFEMINLRLEQSNFQGSLLVVGDFLQLPPVLRGGGEVKFAFESQSWKSCEFEKIELTEIYRTDDRQFISLLNNIRFGQIDENIHNHLNSYIKPLPNDLSKSTFLFGKNSSSDTHNRIQLEFIDNKVFTKEAQIIIHKKSTKEYEVKRFMKDARIEKFLELKVDAPILFTRNSWNYFNGERGVIINIDENFIYIQKKDKKIVKLEATVQDKTEWIEKTVDGVKELIEESLFSIYQFPVKLAFAITIHKSQGMSIEDLIIETNEIFVPSQFYVALSRSSNPLRLNLIAPKVQWYNLAFVNSKALKFVKIN